MSNTGAQEGQQRAYSRPLSEHFSTGFLHFIEHRFCFTPWVMTTREDGSRGPVCYWGGSRGEGGQWAMTRERFERELTRLPEAYRSGEARLACLPSMAGFLVLDLDRNHKRKPVVDAATGKSVNLPPDDGVSTLYGLFAGRPVPRVLEDIERTFPAYTLTPSGGYHLWFKFSSTEPFPSGEIAPGLEIHYDRAPVFMPGSFKNGRPYVFKGDLDKAPELKSLPALYRLLKTAKQKNADKAPTPRPWTFQKAGGLNVSGEELPVSLEFIADWADKNLPQMNNRLYSFSGWAYREGYSLETVKSLVRTRWNLSGADIDHAIRPLENRS